MLFRTRSLPDKISEYLRSQPETGMGYQIVTVLTNDGKIFERVHILDASEISTVDGNADIPFNPYDIVRVEVTHDKTF